MARAPMHPVPEMEAHAWIARLTARDFRNLAHVSVTLPRDGAALVGENGQGKTNLLEAIHYLQLLRSFRGARDVELTRFDTPGFHLSAALEGARVREIAVGFERASKRKRVLVDGAEPDRLTDALGTFPAVLFSPQDAEIVAGAPAARRRFLDMMLALSERPYLVALQRYRAALAHRGAAMRRPGTPSELEATVAVWEPPLAEYGAVLTVARHAWAARHAGRYAELCAIIGDRTAPALRYAASSSLPVSEDVGAMREALALALARTRTADVRRGLTHVGPHRDDLVLTLGARELRTYGSAGQQRTAAIVLRLLEADTRQAAAGAEPIVLLDDPFAELDAGRAARILELLDAQRAGQVVLAVPRDDDIPARFTRLERLRIAAGVITPDPA